MSLKPGNFNPQMINFTADFSTFTLLVPMAVESQPLEMRKVLHIVNVRL